MEFRLRIWSCELSKTITSMFCEICHVVTPARISMSVMLRYVLSPSLPFDTSVCDISASNAIDGWGRVVTYVSCLFFSAGETTTSRHGNQEVTSKGERATGSCGPKGVWSMNVFYLLSFRLKNARFEDFSKFRLSMGTLKFSAATVRLWLHFLTVKIFS